MPFSISDINSGLRFGGRRRDHLVTFPDCPMLNPENHQFLAFAYGPPANEVAFWEIQIVDSDDYYFRNLFEVWSLDKDSIHLCARVTKMDFKSPGNQEILIMERTPLLV